MESVTFANFPTVEEINQTFVSTGLTAKINFGQIKIPTTTLITNASNAIRIVVTMWIFHAAVVLQEGGVCLRGGVFSMKRDIIVGRILLQTTK
jgi:hypothetical protein